MSDNRNSAVASTLISSGLIVACLIGLGRLAGFVREATIVGLFGLTRDADIAVLALTIPDMLTGILLAGGLTAALVPEFRVRGSESGQLFWQTSLAALIVGCCIAATFVFFGGVWVHLLAPGLPGSATGRAVEAFEVVAIAIPLAMLAGVTGAFLNAKERFAIAAAGTFIFNLVVITGLWASKILSVPLLPALVGAVVIAAGMRLFSQAVVAWPLAGCSFGSGRLISGLLLRRFGYGVLASSALVLFPVVARAFASLGDPGSITAINLSIKLVDLPVGGGIAVLATVFLPRLSEKFQLSSGQQEGYALLALALRLGLSVIVAVTLPGIFFMPDLVQVVLGYGEMGASEADRVAGLARVAFLYFPFQAMTLIMAAGFNAKRDTWIPMLINGVGLVVFVTVGQGLREQLGDSGIIVGLIIAYGISAALSLLSFRWRYSANILPLVFPHEMLVALVASLLVIASGGGAGMLLPEEMVLGRAALAVFLGVTALLIMLAGSPEVRERLPGRRDGSSGE